MKKIFVPLLAFVLFSFLLFGCGNQQQSNSEVETKQIIDALGNEVTVPKQPKRIVSLIPSITETVFALNKGEYLVGRTDWCNYPEEVFDVNSVGGMQFDVEKLLSLKPDVVLSHASGAHSSGDGLEQVINAGIPVVIINDAKEIADVYKAIELVGEVIDAKASAANLTASMNEQFQVIQEKASQINYDDQLTVWIEVSPAPDIFTAGKGTFIHELLGLINAKNAAGSVDGWVQFNEEEAVILNPDVIVTTYGYYVDQPVEQVLSRQGWKQVTAVKNERIYDVHSDKLTRSGPRLVKGVEQLANIVYPEVFNE